MPANETQQKMFLCLGISGYIALQGVEVNILMMTRMKTKMQKITDPNLPNHFV